MNSNLQDPNKFEFLLTLDGNIICQRFFNVRDYNPRTRRSINLHEEVKFICTEISDDLKIHSSALAHDKDICDAHTMELFKDEVRELGVALGLPKAMVYRHPFPGPGLGVRILGEVKSEFVDLLRRADAIFIEELINSGWYEKTSQAFAVFLPVKSVGVMGDERTYEQVVALRAVSSVDGMTADWCHLPYEFLGRISNEIINKVKGVNRVVYDISIKPPATIEWE